MIFRTDRENKGTHTFHAIAPTKRNRLRRCAGCNNPMKVGVSHVESHIYALHIISQVLTYIRDGVQQPALPGYIRYDKWVPINQVGLIIVIPKDMVDIRGWQMQIKMYEKVQG